MVGSRRRCAHRSNVETGPFHSIRGIIPQRMGTIHVFIQITPSTSAHSCYYCSLPSLLSLVPPFQPLRAPSTPAFNLPKPSMIFFAKLFCIEWGSGKQR